MRIILLDPFTYLVNLNLRSSWTSFSLPFLFSIRMSSSRRSEGPHDFNPGVRIGLNLFIRQHSVVSNSLWPRGPYSCSLPGSSVHGDSPGKNTGVGCHSLLHPSCQSLRGSWLATASYFSYSYEFTCSSISFYRYVCRWCVLYGYGKSILDYIRFYLLQKKNAFGLHWCNMCFFIFGGPTACGILAS